MDNNPSFSVTRTQLMWAVCLPLAVVVGYLLADPISYGSMAVFVLIATVLCAPIILRWHHPLLVVLWNATIVFNRISESIYIWMFLAVIGFGIAILNRATNRDFRFLVPRSLMGPTVFLAMVVLFTAMFNGGIGMRIFGSEQFGGRSYFYILFALLGMYALASQSIPQKHARLAVFLFFLGGATVAVGNLIYMVGPVAYPLFAFFPLNYAYGQAVSEANLYAHNATRIGGFGLASAAAIAALLSVNGFRGIFSMRRFYLALLVIALLALGAFSGFRSSLLLALMVLLAMAWVEGREQREKLVLAGAIGAVALAGLLPFVSKLPLAMQRSFSFLPVEVHPSVRYDAQISTEWRIQMWRELLPQIPRYLLVGKGYAVDPAELEMSYEARRRGYGQQWDAAALAGDFHNGLLSTIIPLGGVGVVAFAWFLWVGGRILRQNSRFGRPELAIPNYFIFAYFLVRIVYFVMVFGSFYADLAMFAGLIGLSLSLNHGVAQPPAQEGPSPLGMEIDEV